MMKSNKNDKRSRVYLVDKYICNYIASEWFDSSKSDRENARNLGIHHNLIRKIKDSDGYKIPASTLATICFYKNVLVSEFFKTLELKYSDKLNDDFIEKM